VYIYEIQVVGKNIVVTEALKEAAVKKSENWTSTSVAMLKQQSQ